MAMMEIEEDVLSQAKIKVIGVGGGGGNAINTMIASGMEGVDFIAVNTDLQAMDSNLAPHKMQIGNELTRGLGAGANPGIGRDAALEDAMMLQEMLEGSDMVFVTAGMGGGTGTGAAPVIADISRELGILTVGVVTKPFMFEGKKRMRQADDGIIELGTAVDSLITIPNDRLLSVAGQATTMLDAFRKVDEVLLNAVQGISDLIVIHGFINVDFADVRTVMSNTGRALMGAGYAVGDRKALEAAKQAVCSPLLEDTSIDGATGILINITGGPDMTLTEINEAAMLIQEAADEDANIIFGSVVDANMEDQVRITVIATGFDHEHEAKRAAEVRASRPEPRLTENKQPRVTSERYVRPQAAAAPAPEPTPAPEPVLEEEPVYAVATAPAPPPKVMEETAKAAPPPSKPKPPAPPAPVAETQIVEETPAPELARPDAEATLEMAAPTVEPAPPTMAEPAPPTVEPAPPALEPNLSPSEPELLVQEREPRRETADDTDPTPRTQTAFDYPVEPTTAAERVEARRRPQRTTGPHQVPQLHPGLGTREEDKWDIPAFIRRQQRTPGNND